MQKAITTIILLVVIAAGVYFVFSNNAQETEAPVDTEQEAQEAVADNTVGNVPTTAMDTAASGSPSVNEFLVSGDNFKFSVSEIKVKKGNTVRIVFTNQNGNHDWVIDEFGKRTKVLKAGESETIEFIADKAGTFEYYCSVGSHRTMGMKGNLIVE